MTDEIGLGDSESPMDEIVAAAAASTAASVTSTTPTSADLLAAATTEMTKVKSSGKVNILGALTKPFTKRIIKVGDNRHVFESTSLIFSFLSIRLTSLS